MFTSLSLRNFKAFRGLSSLDLAPMTVLIGPNGSGKSTVLQALAFLKQSAMAGALVYSGDNALVELGDFGEVVHSGDSYLDVGVAFGARVASMGTRWPKSKAGLGKLPFALDFSARLKANGWYEQHLAIQTTQGPKFDSDERDEPVIDHEEATFRPSLVQAGAFRYDMGVSSSAPTRKPAHEDVEEDLRLLGRALSRQLDRYFFVPSYRGLVGGHFKLQAQATLDLASAKGFAEFARNVATAMALNRDLEAQIGDWLEGVIGLRIEAHNRPNNIVSVVFRGPKDRRFVEAHNESFGAGQLATIFLQIALAGDDATIAIEEPEIHLYPRAQRQFVEALAKIQRDRNVQFLLTTHSERLLSAILLMVAQGKLGQDDVAIHALQKGEDGVATTRRLEIDEQGRVAGGLPGFFDEDAEVLDEYIRALGRA